MQEPGLGDRLFSQLAGRKHVRHTLYLVFALTAAGSLWFRVWEGRSAQALPWYGALLSVYGFGMALSCRDSWCRAGWLAFGLLIAATFTREILPGWTRAIGLAEVVCCVTLLVVLARLARDGAVLESDTVENHRN